MERRRRVWAFAAYCAVLAAVLFGRAQRAGVVNLRPMETVCRYLRLLRGDYRLELRLIAVVNLVGNMVLFVPMGYFLPRLWPKTRRLWRCLLLGAVVVLSVELVQLMGQVGSCDVDDVLLNLPGVAVGYGLYRLTARFDKK